MKLALDSKLGACMIAGAFLICLSCKTNKVTPSAPKNFGWDEDLKPGAEAAPACGDASTGTASYPATNVPSGTPDGTNPTASSTAGSPSCNLNNGSAVDDKFCVGVPAGNCFSLIIRIPNKDLINDIGLNALSLGSGSSNMTMRLQEACGSAWSAYQARYRGDATHPTRKKFVQKITKMRCIFNFMSAEYVTEDTKLADNEIGLSVRLTKFDIEGSNSATTVNALNLVMDSTTVNTTFRSVFVYGGRSLLSGGSPWKTVDGFGYSPYTVKRKIDRSISWSFSLETLMQSLSKIDMATVTDEAVGAFINSSKAMITNVLARKAPVTSSFVLVGIGYNTLKMICGENAEKCKTIKTTTKRLDNANSGLADLIPTAEANEAIRMGLIKSIEGVLDKFFETAKSAPLEKLFGLEVDQIPDIE